MDGLANTKSNAVINVAKWEHLITDTIMNSKSKFNAFLQSAWTVHVLGLLAFLALTAIFHFGWQAPKQSQLNDLEIESSRLTKMAADLPDLRKQHVKLVGVAPDSDELTSGNLLPETANEAEFLELISAFTARNDIEIDDYACNAVSDANSYSRLGIDISFVGSYEQICQFLTVMNDGSFVVDISEIKITASNQPNQQTLNVHLELCYQPRSQNSDQTIASR